MAITITLTAEQLFPPKQPEDVRAAIEACWMPDRDHDQRTLLRRGPTPPERVALQRRRDLLTDKWLAHARHTEVKAFIATFRLGFTVRSGGESDQDAINSQYTFTLRDTPLWALVRACGRFSDGAVKPEEVGAKHLDVNYAPSTAQIAIIARTFYGPLLKERRVIAGVLGGVVPPREQSPQERQREGEAIKRMTAEATAAMAGANLERAEQDVRQEESRRRRTALGLEARRQEYREAGLEPPAGDVFTSLPMLLHLGWRIEDYAGGRRMLVAPAKEKPVQRPTSYAGMGS